MALGALVVVGGALWMRPDDGEPWAWRDAVLAAMIAGVVLLAGWWSVRAARRSVRLDRDGVVELPDGEQVPWQSITLIRVVFVPQQGMALCMVSGGRPRVLRATLSIRRRRMRAIRDACSSLSVIRPGVFDFEMLDGAIPAMPSKEFLFRYSATATATMATESLPAPPATRTRNVWLMVFVTVLLAARILVPLAIDGGDDGDSDGPPPTVYHFTSSDLVAIDELVATSDLCHGIWRAPPPWSGTAAVERVSYLRHGEVVWQIVAPAGGAVSFEVESDEPSYSVADLVEFHGYRLTGDMGAAHARPLDHIVVDAPDRHLDLTCAEI